MLPIFIFKEFNMIKCNIKILKDKGELCQSTLDDFICNRIEGHKGKHHAHDGEMCFLKWN